MEAAGGGPSLKKDVQRLRSLLGEITEGLGIFGADTGHFHAYGRLDTAQAAQDFGDTVRRMRAGVEQYKGWRAAPDPDAAQEAHVHHYLLVLRDHTEQQEHMERVRLAIAGAVAMARERRATGPAGGPLLAGQAVSHLEDIAGQLSLNFFWDEDSAIFTLLLDNLLFDFHFEGHTVQEVKVTHIVEGTTTSAPSQQLKQLVESKSWEELQATVAWISDGPKLLAANPQLPQAMLQTFETSLLDVTAAERKGGLEEDICSGHGLAQRTEVGVALSYYCSPFFSLQAEVRQQAFLARKGWMQLPEAKRLWGCSTTEVPLLQRAFVTLQRLSFTTTVHVSNLTDGGVWSALEAVGSTETNVCCSLVLDPPVAVAAHSDLFSLLPSDAAATDCAPCAGNENCSKDATLLDLLQLGSESDLELNGMKMKFVYSGEPGAAIMLYRLPIAQPLSLLSVLDHLRQQLVFNELLRSCYLPSDSAESRDVCTVFEVMFEAPQYISVMFLNAKTQEFINLDVQLTGGVGLEAHFSPAQSGLPDAKATALLQRSRHIPLTLLALLECNG